jgi:hydrogenase-4 membrane subunit HyfE
MSTKQWNWRLWAGFTIAFVALFVYAAVVFRSRDILWLSLALFIVSIVLLGSGLQRAYRQRESYRGQVAGPIVALASLLILGVFAFASFEISKHFAAAGNAPKVGQAAPQFTLVDTEGKTVSLAGSLSPSAGQPGSVSRAPKAVLLVFYRGYW